MLGRLRNVWRGWSGRSTSGPLMVGQGRQSAAGKSVSVETALTLSAVWACVSRTAQVIASLPLDQYQRAGAGMRVRVDDDLSDILTVSPNRDQTSFEFWQTMVAHLVLRGNGIAERGLIGSRTASLTPLINAEPERDCDGALVYAFNDRGQRVVLPAEKVFHLRGFGAGNGVGLSAIRYGANAMGAALAADETAGAFFEGGMMPSGFVTTDTTLNPEQREQLSALLSSYAGSRRAGKVMVLEAGLKYAGVQMNPEDVQLIETRRFQIEDVCRFFGVPPIVIGHSSDGQTMWGTGVESVLISWLTMGINPLLSSIEARILKDLVSDPRRRFFEFNREAMLQMDSAAKINFLSKGVSGGLMTPNEGRQKINLPGAGAPGDQLFMNGTFTPIGDLGKGRSNGR